MDYSFIFRQLQSILSDNRISLIPIGFVVLNILIFIVSKTFRKAGILVLALAFGIDYTIKSLPIDLYYLVPWLYNAVTALYILGFIIFFFKVLKMVVRISNSSTSPAVKKKSKFRQFLSFAGLTPFLIMMVVNIADVNGLIPTEILRLLTSLAFLYMVIKTLSSTYKYLRTKESLVLRDKMDFEEIKEFLREDSADKNISSSKNAGRRIRKASTNPPSYEPTEVIDKEKVRKAQKVRVADINKEANRHEVDREVYESSSPNPSSSNKLSNTELIRMVSGDFDTPKNETTLRITNLKTGEVSSYTTDRPILKIHENKEYKIDLEFETVNEYDYGRLIDILLTYSKDKDLYKFELIVSPAASPNSKIIFFDPSNIFDIDETDYANVGGKVISMNFPKYKINFITGN